MVKSLAYLVIMLDFFGLQRKGARMLAHKTLIINHLRPCAFAPLRLCVLSFGASQNGGLDTGEKTVLRVCYS
jgi:hypothetical protein